MNLPESIDSYIDAMKDIKSSINQLQGDKFLENHKKTLFFSLLETLSKGVYGDKYTSNYTRFEKFILEFCQWEDAKKVSLQQSALILEKTKANEFQNLKLHVFHQISKFPMATAIPFSYDSPIEEIKKLMPKGETTIDGVSIYSLTHINLLWKYRNNLVHEARSIGSIDLFKIEEAPHYVHYTKIEKERIWEIWKINYPIIFFNKLTEKALENIREWLIKNKIDPANNFDSDELWIKPRKKRNSNNEFLN